MLDVKVRKRKPNRIQEKRWEKKGFGSKGKQRGTPEPKVGRKEPKVICWFWHCNV